MKSKIFNRLKQEYAHLGLDETFLSGLADMLATSGLVTDENIEGVVANQKNYLESVQKSNDKRVQNAIEKVKKSAEEEAAKAREESEKVHAAKLADLEKQIANLKKDEQKPPVVDDKMPEWYKAEKAERERQLKEMQDTIKSLQSEKSESDKELAAIKEARANEEAARAAQKRTDTINAKAKEKGIPDWLINRGFASLPSDADDAAIDKYLSEFATEIQANFLPDKNGKPQFDGKQATKEEVGSIIDKILPAAK